MRLKNIRPLFSVLVTVLLILTACQSSSTRSGEGQDDVTFTDATKADPNTVELYVHTQPQYDTDAEEKDKPYVKKRGRSDIWQRLRAGFRLPTSTHPRVLAEIRWFKNNPDYLERVYDRAEPVLHYVLEQVEKRGIPTELALLPVVESAFQPFAFSHAAASGIWQFIPSTGKIYGLRQDWWYDGRRDLVASTRASLAYLSKLHRQFNGDWMLALASYNVGEGRIAREVRRNKRRGRPATFFYLRIPKETRAYVPKLLAITAIIKNSKKYGLTLREIPDEPQFQSVFVGSQIDLAIAAELAGITLDEIYKLNPGFNRFATSPKGPHRLLIPIEVASEFKQKLKKLDPEELMSYTDYKAPKSISVRALARQYKITPGIIKSVNDLKSNRIRRGQVVKIPVPYVHRTKYKLSLTQRIKGSERLSYRRDKRRGRRYRRGRGRRIVYRVRRGDTMYRVARRYRVSRNSIARWNGISRRARLRRGQRLVIYKRGRRASIRRFRARYSKRTRRSTRRRTITYVVRRGDTLYSISRRYRVSVRNLKRWNRRRIGRRGYIYPGLRLRIRRR